MNNKSKYLVSLTAAVSLLSIPSMSGLATAQDESVVSETSTAPQNKEFSLSYPSIEVEQGRTAKSLPRGNYPEGTTFKKASFSRNTWSTVDSETGMLTISPTIQSPMLGNYSVFVDVTYPDGTTDIIESRVTVKKYDENSNASYIPPQYADITVKQGETKVNNAIINSYDPNDTAETEGARYVVYNSSNNPFVSINRLNGDITIAPTKHDKPGRYPTEVHIQYAKDITYKSYFTITVTENKSLQTSTSNNVTTENTTANSSTAQSTTPTTVTTTTSQKISDTSKAESTTEKQTPAISTSTTTTKSTNVTTTNKTTEPKPKDTSEVEATKTTENKVTTTAETTENNAPTTTKDNVEEDNNKLTTVEPSPTTTPTITSSTTRNNKAEEIASVLNAMAAFGNLFKAQNNGEPIIHTVVKTKDNEPEVTISDSKEKSNVDNVTVVNNDDVAAETVAKGSNNKTVEVKVENNTSSVTATSKTTDNKPTTTVNKKAEENLATTGSNVTQWAIVLVTLLGLAGFSYFGARKNRDN